MRFELSGSLVRPQPAIITFVSDTVFNPAYYMNQGYTHFDVICIAGGGGYGGGIDTQDSGTLVRSFGGAGGGGGLHRVRGLLSVLPESCPVVVGRGGMVGTDDIDNPSLTTDGGDGGYSSFNDTTCRASGGKGGKRVQTNSLTVSTHADGGEGGVGNRIIAGGGAAGGVAGIPSDTGPGTPGTNGEYGTFFSNIGKGGGGGAGGVGKYAPGGVTCNAATTGGRGSYNPSDTSVYGPEGTPQDDWNTGSENVFPGSAGGAKAAPVTGLPTMYGETSDHGFVALRLTAE